MALWHYWYVPPNRDKTYTVRICCNIQKWKGDSLITSYLRPGTHAINAQFWLIDSNRFCSFFVSMISNPASRRVSRVESSRNETKRISSNVNLPILQYHMKKASSLWNESSSTETTMGKLKDFKGNHKPELFLFCLMEASAVTWQSWRLLQVRRKTR